MDHHIHQYCEAFVNRAGRIPALIHKFKEAEKRAKTLKNTNKVSSCPPTGHLKPKKHTKKNKYYPPPLPKKTLSLQQDFYNLYHEGFKILQIITKT